jgi:Amt family ammonium transporter
VLTTLLVIGSVAAVFAMLLGDPAGFSALHDWSAGLLAAISLLALAGMTVGLAMSYAPERAPVLGTLERLLLSAGMIILIWIAFGYSLTYTGGSTDFIGGFSKIFLGSVKPDSRVSTFTVGHMISEISFVIFQGCVAVIASALVVGPLGKRMKPAAVVLFAALWATLVFFPIAHMAWYWAGPDMISDAAKVLAAASDSAAKAAAQARLDDVIADAGWLFKKGLLDYAGGTVVALTAGTSGLVGLFLLDDSKSSASPDRSQRMSGPGALGLALMWLAWFGINAASNLDFGDSVTRLAMANCFSATGTAAVAGAAAEWLIRGQASVRGVLYGTLAGIVAVTPASAFAGTVGAAALGLCAGATAIASVHASSLGAQAWLPVIHASGGLIGTLATGILVNPSLGGTGVLDYTTGTVGDYDLAAQMNAQSWGVAVTLTWAGLGSLVLFEIIDRLVGLRQVNRPAPGAS